MSTLLVFCSFALFHRVLNVASALAPLQAATVLDQHILPLYDERAKLGRDEYLPPPPGSSSSRKSSTGSSQAAVRNSDTRLDQTYGEFPLDSLDLLLTQALHEQKQQQTSSSLSCSQDQTVVDVGSGCGRLVLYMGLTRPQWMLHGVEISPPLHQVALESHQRAATAGYLNDDQQGHKIQFHLGSAAEYAAILQKASIVFMYSTAFPSRGFSTASGTLVLASEWNDLLAATVSSDCIVITTDKSLDERFEIVSRIDVPGELFDCTGFLHRLR